jgi:hypothetical protein
MLANPQATFVMLSFCYAQRPNYLHRIVFPSPCILQHYTKFDVHTIVMSKKLLGSRSFGTTMGHLAHHQVVLPIFLKGLGLPSVVRHVALAFLGCWALIAITLVFHFKLDDHLTLLNVVAHVETNTYPFQVTPHDIHALLPKVVRSHVLPFKSLVMQSYFQM